MNKKIAFISFAVLVVFAFTVWAVTTSGPQSQHEEVTRVNIEQVSAEKAADCNPSTCTPEQAAKCPHPNMTETSATASTEKTDANCPATKECPPSKCQGDKKAASSTATL